MVNISDPISESAERCQRCGGIGSHGLVHTRYGNGGGANSPCPLATEEDRHVDQ